MNRIVPTSFATALLLTASFFAIPASAPPAFAAETVTAAAAVGKQAPEFNLTDTNGKKRSLADANGKFLVLEWVNFDCPFVRKHYESKNMQNLQKTFTGKGVVWYSICSSAPNRQGNYTSEKLNELMKSNGAAPTAYLADPDGKVGRSYGATSTPHMFVIDPKGVLIYAGAIDDNNSTDISDVKQATNYVQKALTEAMAKKPVSTPTTQAYGCSVKYAK
ncbi:MAG: thioredoxin family protein [Candidatus Obscuribacterales bacterium]|nr:thioredoxin family protein [Candidatus Obscuribacterales bacterium]